MTDTDGSTDSESGENTLVADRQGGETAAEPAKNMVLSRRKKLSDQVKEIKDLVLALSQQEELICQDDEIRELKGLSLEVSQVSQRNKIDAQDQDIEHLSLALSQEEELTHQAKKIKKLSLAISQMRAERQDKKESVSLSVPAPKCATCDHVDCERCKGSFFPWLSACATCGRRNAFPCLACRSPTYHRYGEGLVAAIQFVLLVFCMFGMTLSGCIVSLDAPAFGKYEGVFLIAQFFAFINLVPNTIMVFITVRYAIKPRFGKKTLFTIQEHHSDNCDPSCKPPMYKFLRVTPRPIKATT